MVTDFERSRTLDQLEGDAWPEEPSYDSHLVTTCHALRRKPVGEFTIEDLRIMIGQNIGLDHLVPVAVEKLLEDPLAEGDFYPGDLLKNVLSVPSGFWTKHERLRATLADRLRSSGPYPEDLGDLVASFVRG
ncbi:MAG: contact-dependent growth inhibition system immunity protein [Planctomycetota bacterium]